MGAQAKVSINRKLRERMQIVEVVDWVHFLPVDLLPCVGDAMLCKQLGAGKHDERIDRLVPMPCAAAPEREVAETSDLSEAELTAASKGRHHHHCTRKAL